VLFRSFEKGLAGHSDANVLVHALMDALLGAIAAGDIGRHFPDTDPGYKGIDSLLLLDLPEDEVPIIDIGSMEPVFDILEEEEQLAIEEEEEIEAY